MQNGEHLYNHKKDTEANIKALSGSAIKEGVFYFAKDTGKWFYGSPNSTKVLGPIALGPSPDSSNDLTLDDGMLYVSVRDSDVLDTEGLTGGGDQPLQDLLDELSTGVNQIPLAITKDKVLFGGSSDNITYENNFHWDSTSKRLGVNVASPTDTLHVGGTARIDTISTYSGATELLTHQSNVIKKKKISDIKLTEFDKSGFDTIILQSQIPYGTGTGIISDAGLKWNASDILTVDGLVRIEGKTTSGRDVLITKGASDFIWETTNSVGVGRGTTGTGINSTHIGWEAGKGADGARVTSLGRRANYQATGERLTGVGVNANSQATGAYLTGVGANANYQATGGRLTGVGYASNYQAEGNNLTGVGYQANSQAEGNNLTGVGYQTNRGMKGNRATSVGHNAGYINTSTFLTGDDNTFLGANAKFDASNLTMTNATALGANAVAAQSNSVVLGNAADVAIRHNKPDKALDVNGEVKIRTINNDNSLAHILVEDSGVIKYRDASSLAGDQDLQSVTEEGNETNKYICVGGLTSYGEINTLENYSSTGSEGPELSLIRGRGSKSSPQVPEYQDILGQISIEGVIDGSNNFRAFEIITRSESPDWSIKQETETDVNINGLLAIQMSKDTIRLESSKIYVPNIPDTGAPIKILGVSAGGQVVTTDSSSSEWELLVESAKVDDIGDGDKVNFIGGDGIRVTNPSGNNVNIEFDVCRGTINDRKSYLFQTTGASSYTVPHGLGSPFVIVQMWKLDNLGYTLDRSWTVKTDGLNDVVVSTQNLIPSGTRYVVNIIKIICPN